MAMERMATAVNLNGLAGVTVALKEPPAKQSDGKVTSVMVNGRTKNYLVAK